MNQCEAIPIRQRGLMVSLIQDIEAIPALPTIKMPSSDDILTSIFSRIERDLIIPALGMKTSADFFKRTDESMLSFLPRLIAAAEFTKRPATDEEWEDIERLAENFGGDAWYDAIHFGRGNISRANRAAGRLRERGFPKTAEDEAQFMEYAWASLFWSWSLCCFLALVRHQQIANSEVMDRVLSLLEGAPRKAWCILRSIELESEAREPISEKFPLEVKWDAEYSALEEDAELESRHLLRGVA